MPRIHFRIALLTCWLTLSLTLGPFAEAATYTYDSLNRLIEAVYAEGSVIQYTYDKGGNMLQVNAAMTYKPFTEITDISAVFKDVFVSAVAWGGL